jgi:hypothetical protein
VGTQLEYRMRINFCHMPVYSLHTRFNGTQNPSSYAGRCVFKAPDSRDGVKCYVGQENGGSFTVGIVRAIHSNVCQPS